MFGTNIVEEENDRRQQQRHLKLPGFTHFTAGDPEDNIVGEIYKDCNTL